MTQPGREGLPRYRPFDEQHGRLGAIRKLRRCTRRPDCTGGEQRRRQRDAQAPFHRSPALGIRMPGRCRGAASAKPWLQSGSATRTGTGLWLSSEPLPSCPNRFEPQQ
jgi:hypothetical protein